MMFPVVSGKSLHFVNNACMQKKELALFCWKMLKGLIYRLVGRAGAQRMKLIFDVSGWSYQAINFNNNNIIMIGS